MTTKTSRFVFDWWVVQKRMLYLAIALFYMLSSSIFGDEAAAPQVE